MPVLWAYRDPLGFPTKESSVWHVLGFVLRVVPAFLIIQDTWLTLAYGFYFWIVFELAINYFTKKDDLFYTDKSTLSGVVLHSFYIDGKTICKIKIGCMLVVLGIRYDVFKYLIQHLVEYIKNLL